MPITPRYSFRYWTPPTISMEPIPSPIGVLYYIDNVLYKNDENLKPRKVKQIISEWDPYGEEVYCEDDGT